MKFEEALTALRAGAKIWHPGMEEDEYYAACRIGLVGIETSLDQMLTSIVWMKGDKQHPDMLPKWNPYDPKTDPCKHGMSPMMNLLWVISEGWEILDVIK